MANPTCNGTTLITNAAKFRQDAGLTRHQQLALLVYLRTLELNALGGSNYTGAAGLAQLAQDAATLECGFTTDERFAATLSLTSAQATAAGASVPATVGSMLSALGAFIGQTDGDLKMMNLLLTCKLGVHKAYPQ